MTQLSPRNRPPDPERSKSTLYCPECDHASPADGDWTRRLDDGDVRYDCPICGTTITRRPRSVDEPDHPTAETAVGRVLQSSIDAWRASMHAGLRSATEIANRSRRNR